MKPGDLLIVREDQYLYNNEPLFPWHKVLRDSLLIFLESEENEEFYNIRVLVDDGRTGYLNGDFLEVLK
jgi:hypothetical protein